MKCSIPTNQSFNPLNNYIDMTEYTKICNEFNIDPNEDFRIHIEPNNGAGYIYDENNNKTSGNYATNKKTESDYRNNPWTLEEPSGYLGQYGFDAHLTYGNQWGGWLSGVWVKHCKVVQDTDDGWTRFMLQKSNGFTRAGIVRINDSIRMYIYCLLGAQPRTAIIGQSGMSPNTPKQFVENLYDAIYADLSIPDSIEKYQNAINNSHSKLDFAIGSGLYMIPSNLVMNIGSLDNYNNNILIATNNMDFGINSVNNKLLPNLGLPDNNNLLSIPDNNKLPDLKNPDTKYKDYYENKYILPFIIGGSIGLLVYFIK
jgi:hypothetical protein